MICTDTGGGSSGELSCVLLPEGDVIQSQSPQAPNRPGFAQQPPAAAKKPWWQIW
jgi:hypothetical protein